MQLLEDLVTRLADRDAARTEATVQADVRSLLLNAPLQLGEGDVKEVVLESPVGQRRRIDVETGMTVIEVKRDLRKGKVIEDAIEQLQGYVETREREMDCRYVGILTDGAEWRCYHLTSAGLHEVATLTLRKGRPDLDALLIWLEGVLATVRGIKPVPDEIMRRLGAGSSSHALDRASLAALYTQNRTDDAVRMKRDLWARLLTTALGSQFEDRDELFVEHTLLVNSAEIVAHAVLGLPVENPGPASLLSGSKFSEHGIYGVVESDFFDWVVDVPGGEALIRTLARRLARFDWGEVEHDVLKVLYESVISTETRKKLGEYYTPDWLAEKMVAEVVQDPLSERVLDPACGSGTFLFHAVRSYLAAAESADRSVSETLSGVASHVLGMDLHPVAVTLARVTYLLAIGRERLVDPRRGEIQIPVYLGDSMQWQQKRLELWTSGHLVIHVEEDRDLFVSELKFPESLLAESRKFDQLVEELATQASQRPAGSAVPSLESLFERHGIAGEARDTVAATFRTMCRLHDQGRDHIWSYYIRNLARPVWLAQPGNRVNVLVGNPPWLAYRHMTGEMQGKFREMSEARGLWHGATVATHQDLSGLFVTRVLQLYLRKDGGRFAFVMPNAALDRAQFAGFRTAEFPDPESQEPVRVAFEIPWDLRQLRPHFFPRGSAVVFGSRVSDGLQCMPTEAEAWTGRVPGNGAGWGEVERKVERRPKALKPVEEEVESRYVKRFRNGATIFPRVLFLMERVDPGPLGVPAGRVKVRSVRSAYEKPPWKDVETLDAVVESEFLRPMYLGEHVLPYRTLEPAEALLPWDLAGRLDEGSARIALYPGLSKWWDRVNEIWETHRSSDRLSLLEQLDYHGKLSSQYPIQPRRIVYNASGMHLCAAQVVGRRAVIEHSLYWGTAQNEEEALYLCAILNSAAVTQLVRPMMSYGKDERHIDKYVWRLSVPMFAPEDPIHGEISSLAAEVEAEIQEIELDEDRHFVSLRRDLRKFLKQSATAQKIEELVVELLNV